MENEYIERHGCLYFYPSYIPQNPYRSIPPIMFDTESSCWIWQWSFYPDGRPRINFEGGTGKYAYRFVWENEIGPINPDHELHHMASCRFGKRCVNPEHKESLTPSQHRARHIETGVMKD